MGTFRLCKKLPSTISMDAQTLPTTAAFNHTAFKGMYLKVFNSSILILIDIPDSS